MRADLKHYTALDGMRGLAALLVVVFHATPFFGQVVPGGYLAVDMFFVLSGFVIEHAYGQKLRAGLGVWRFTKLRLIRFYPLYLVGLLAGVGLELLLIQVGAKNAVAPDMLILQAAIALALVPAFFETDAFPLNIPAWSLFVELVVNVVYGALARFLNNRVLYGIAVVSFVLFAIQFHSSEKGMPGPHVQDLPVVLVRAIFSFAMGIVVYRHRRIFEINPAWVVLAILVLLVLPISENFRFVYDLICIGFAFPLLVWVAAGAEVRNFSGVMTFMGGISYGLYAIHWPVLWIIRGIADKLGVPMPLAGIVMLLGLVLACYLLDKAFDQPLRSWLKTKFVCNY